MGMGMGVGMSMACESMYPQRPEDGVGCPGDKLIGSRGPPYLCARNQTQRLQENIKYS